MDNIKMFFSMMWFYVTTCFKKYFDFSGRARRKEYWFFVLFTWIVGNLFSLAYAILDIPLIDILSNIYAALVIIPTLAVAFRRVHDIGYSGKYVVAGYVLIIISALMGLYLLGAYEGMVFQILGYALFILPLVVILAYFYFFTRDSQPGENKWGANPKEIEA